MARNNTKSFRCSDETLDYIESCDGETFADKVENMALRYVKNLEIRQNRLNMLDKDIERKNDEYYSVLNKINDVKLVLTSLTTINKSLEAITGVLQLAPAAELTEEENVLQFTEQELKIIKVCLYYNRTVMKQRFELEELKDYVDLLDKLNVIEYVKTLDLPKPKL
ncbi:hypothetical protein [Clostridium intestinale]|uniref:Uncharacterized protein n=1 Tax=Clostridium intestinale URNW TaxID=1294142 RepID=U2NH70_9CLOT|nr:hypothetical protein [Clostridium intestinale]ERK28216.1 hypothetical protein CINTURNW_4625 [Clostridium intestinale URNW]